MQTEIQVKFKEIDNGLSILDKTTMGASVEGRVPYLDHQIIEYLFSSSTRGGSSFKSFFLLL